MTDAPNPSAAKTEPVGALVKEASYWVGNPSAWESYDDGASEIIRRLVAALTHPQPSLSVGLDREAVARVKLREPFGKFQTVGDILNPNVIDDIALALAAQPQSNGD